MAAPSKLRKSMQCEWRGGGKDREKRKHQNEYSVPFSVRWYTNLMYRERRRTIQRGEWRGRKNIWTAARYTSKRASSFTCDSRSTSNSKVTWKYSRTSFFHFSFFFFLFIKIFFILVGASQRPAKGWAVHGPRVFGGHLKRSNDEGEKKRYIRLMGSLQGKFTFSKSARGNRRRIILFWDRSIFLHFLVA